MSGPLISVVIPSHNRADLLAETVRSVWAQDYRPLEIVVVDDGSTDATPELLDALGRESAGLPGVGWQVVRQAQRGVSAARNVGWARSRGDRVLFLDSDDLLEPGALRVLGDALEASGEGYAHGAVTELQDGPEQRTLRLWAHPGWLEPEDLFKYTSLVMAHLYSRRVLEAAGPWNEALRRFEDWEFHSRVRMVAGGGVEVPQVVARYRLHRGQRLSPGMHDPGGVWDEWKACGALGDWLAARGPEPAAVRPMAKVLHRMLLRFVRVGDARGASTAAQGLRRWLARAPHGTGVPAVPWASRLLVAALAMPWPLGVFRGAWRLGLLRRSRCCGFRRTRLPRLLFVSPVLPGADGTGIMRRAHAAFTVLSQRHQVDLLLVPAEGVPSPRLLRLRGARVLVADRQSMAREAAPWCRRPGPGGWWLPRVRLHPGHYAVFHAFRLATAATVLRLASAHRERSVVQLDLDDVDSMVRMRAADEAEQAGRTAEAVTARRETRLLRMAEKQLLRRFDRVFVCSGLDAGRPELEGVRAEVLPNVVPVPQEVRGTEQWTGRLLFIGALGYPPNRGAALWLAEELMPRLYRPSGPVLHVAGYGASRALADRLRAAPGVVFHGAVHSSAEQFLAADVLLVPLWTVGGTRIKILEAFSLGLPVVSTERGVEGLEAEAGVHYLRAETVEEFAAAVERLGADAELRRRLARSAGELQRARYHPGRLAVLDPAAAGGLSRPGG